jgi:hypothetical protein
VLTLDHADGPDAGAEGGEGRGGAGGPRTNMTWLTKSDLAGERKLRGIVEKLMGSCVEAGLGEGSLRGVRHRRLVRAERGLPQRQQ